ncbi:Essential protein Yae1, N terminal [Sporothrix epigloea]|uniref:Protein YAE1 n=1 Tax=Sporothrix epigloea TaxID=1892477 RepID=A0ABP0D959_9PEZI
MHQRPPADPIDKDDLLAPDGTSFATMDQSPGHPHHLPQDMVIIDSYGAVEPDVDASTVYHGDISDELSDESGTAIHRTADLFDDVFGLSSTTGDLHQQERHHYHQSHAPASSIVTASSPSVSAASALSIPLDHTQEHRDAHPSDMNRLRHDHSTAGYREGLSAGKTKTLQVGFDEGYPLGAALGTMVGGLLGLLEGLVVAVPGDTGTIEEQSESPSALLARARKDLSARSIYSPAFFAPDGTWTYDLDESGEAGETTIYDVAGAHPLIKTWRMIVDGQLDRTGIRWGKPGEEAALAAAIGLVTEDEDADGGPAHSSTKAASTTSPRPDGVPAASRAPTSSSASALDW